LTIHINVFSLRRKATEEAAHANELLRYGEVALSLCSKKIVSYGDHLDVRVWAFLIACKSSAICARLIQHRHPSTLKEQLIPIAEIAVRTREGIHLWNENLDIETALPQVA
jgi:hypothetical protein